MYFADVMPHPATTIIAEAAFDGEPEEIDFNATPLEQTGTDANDDDHESND